MRPQALRLRDAVGKSSGLVRVGLLDSIGVRRDAAAVGLLVPLLTDQDLRVQGAGAMALGKIATPGAVDALVAAHIKARGEARAKIAQGLIVAADALLAAGKTGDAAGLYFEAAGVHFDFQPPPAPPLPIEDPAVRIAALCGLHEVAARDAYVVAKVEPLLAGDEARGRALGAWQLSSMSPAKLLAVAGGMAKLPSASQVAVLAAIRICGDPSLAPVAMAAAKSKDEAVRRAAIQTLGIIGQAPAVPLLLELAPGQDRAAETARWSLVATRRCGRG